MDLTRLDAVEISHRDGDHTTGLEVLVAGNPTVPIYAPQEGAFFRCGVPKEFLARTEGACRAAAVTAGCARTRPQCDRGGRSRQSFATVFARVLDSAPARKLLVSP